MSNKAQHAKDSTHGRSVVDKAGKRTRQGTLPSGAKYKATRSFGKRIIDDPEASGFEGDPTSAFTDKKATVTRKSGGTTTTTSRASRKVHWGPGIDRSSKVSKRTGTLPSGKKYTSLRHSSFADGEHSGLRQSEVAGSKKFRQHEREGYKKPGKWRNTGSDRSTTTPKTKK